MGRYLAYYSFYLFGLLLKELNFNSHLVTASNSLFSYYNPKLWSIIDRRYPRRELSKDKNQSFNLKADRLAICIRIYLPSVA